MIIIAAWLNNKSGIGHYTRSRKYFEFLKVKKKKVKFLTFKNLNDLYLKIKKYKSKVILLDTYLFSKKIEILLRKNFRKIIIVNDYQFNIPKDFYLLDSFRFGKKIDHEKKYLGQEYAVLNNERSSLKIKKTINFLIILHRNYQNLFYKIQNLIFREKKNNYKKFLFVNILEDKIKNNFKSKKNFEIKSFVTQNKLINYAKKSEYIISPGGQTMINLIENNQFLNVYKTSNNQNFYIMKLKLNKCINKIDFSNFKLKKNRGNNYINLLKKNKILEIFKEDEKIKKILQK